MKKIFTFHGADHKCGTSMLAQCTAERIAVRRPELKVLLIHAEGAWGLDFSPKVCETFDKIGPYLAQRLVDVNELAEKCLYKQNLFIIGGAAKHGSISFYHPEMLEYLLEGLAEKFDIIICDSGSRVEHGLALGALLAADCVYMVTTQAESAMKRFERMSTLYEKLGIHINKFIVNALQKSLINTPEIIALRTGFDIKDILCVKKSFYGADAEHDGTSLLAFREKPFIKSIDLIADSIIEYNT